MRNPEFALRQTLIAPARFELATSGVENRHSIQLNYEAMVIPVRIELTTSDIASRHSIR